MNFAKNIGGPIILNTNSDLYGCPVVYAENDAIFDGCLDKITLASGKDSFCSTKNRIVTVSTKKGNSMIHTHCEKWTLGRRVLF